MSLLNINISNIYFNKIKSVVNMVNPFKSENYKTNLDSLKKAIEEGDVKEVDKQYNKTVSVLSGTLDGLTDRAEDVAKHVVRSDLGNPIGKKPTGFFAALMERLKKIFTRGISIKDSMSNFISTLPPVTSETSMKYTEILSKIADLERSKKGQEKNRPYGVNLEDRITSKQEENPLYVPYGSDSGYGSLSDEDHGYEDILNFQEKKSEKLTNNSQDSELPKEEPIYATIPKEHIEAKRERKQKQTKPPISPKPLPPVPKKTTGAYISLNTPDVNWGTYPGDIEKVQKANNIPSSPQPRTQKPKEPKSPSIKERAKSFEESGTKHDKRPRANTSPPATQISVKAMVGQFEKGKEGRQ